MSIYTFGAFQINSNVGGLGYFLESKNLDIPKVKPAEYAIARRDGSKKSSEMVEPRQINVGLKVVGVSYTDLISRLDSLQQALALRSQQLCIHPDSRYFSSVDCIDATVKLVQGNVVQCKADCVFKAYDPYAYSNTTSTYDTGVIALTSSGGFYNFPAINITGGGNYWGYPSFHIINKTSSGNSQWTSLSISQTQDSQTLKVNSTSSAQLPLNLNDYVDVNCNPAATNGWSVITNGNAYSDPQGLFPVMEPGTTTFNISIASASAVSAECIISWIPRYAS